MDTLTHPGVSIENGPTLPTWADEPAITPAAAKNVGENERLLSAVGGAALALWGLSCASTTRMLAVGVGAALLYRSVTGHCHAYDALGMNSADLPPR